MVDRCDVAIVGAGVVGLATAWELSGLEVRVTVLERHPAVGLEQSTHNSQVVHSGAFVPPGTVQAGLVREGNRRLYEVAAAIGVRAERCGTLVAAVDPAEVDRLDQYERWGRANGVADATRLGPAGAHAIEPGIGPVVAGLWLPSGGRVDAPALVDGLARSVRGRGGAVELGYDLVSATRAGSGWRLAAADGREVLAGAVVNAAGVGSATVAGLLGSPGYRIFPCLGEYARVVSAQKERVRTMVYGFPPEGYPGIGVHLTRRLDGELWVGPTATYLETPNPPPTPHTPLVQFADEAARLLPGVTVDDLSPAPAGVRAKTVPPGSGRAFGEFVLNAEPAGARAFQMVGIESPGLTSSFAIGQRVAAWYRTLSP
jgi:glycerol-3-phosphate dehydrogenase